MKVIVGGTYREYMRWRAEQGLSPMEAFYIGDDPERLLGLELKEEDIVRLGPISKMTEETLRTRIR